VSALLIALAAAPARADTIRAKTGEITAGWGSLGFQWNVEGFLFDGGGLFVGTSMEDERGFLQLTAPPAIVAQGRPLDLSATFTTLDPIGGQFKDSFALLSPFTMTLRASPTRMDCRNPDGDVGCNGSAPFTFRADATVTPENGQPFVAHLVGGGTAVGFLLRTPTDNVGAVEFHFGASPTPEPATLALFAAGALMAGTRRLRRSAVR